MEGASGRGAPVAAADGARRTWCGGTAPRAGGPTTPSATMVAAGLGRAGRRRLPRALEGPARGGAPSPTSTAPPGRWPASLHARGRRPGRRRRVPAAELGRGRHHVLGRRLPRRGRRPDRALLRRQGGRLHPAARRRPTSSSPPTASATATTSPTYEALLAEQPDAAVARRRRHGRRTICPPARRRSTSLLDGEPLARTGSRSTPTRRPIDRVHVGHDPRPQGRHPLAPHDRLRDPPARPHVPQGRAAADHRRAGRTLHRDAQRVPGAAAARPPGQPHRRVGPGRGPAPDARGGPRRQRAGPPSSSRACSTTPTSPTSTSR